MSTHVWLRAESKPHERRTALTPDHARQLLSAGFRVTVEQCPLRIFTIDEYQALGCEIADRGSWETKAPLDAFILGLKELPAGSTPLVRRHIHFAHIYKEQRGWQQALSRYEADGALYDLEFLVDGAGRRVAAFGYWAGFAGAALAAIHWGGLMAQTPRPIGAISAWKSQAAMVSDAKAAIVEHSPRTMVIGALGRSGRGACDLFRQIGVEPIAWDLEETKQGGPFEELLDLDLLINCVFVNGDVPPFVTQASLNTPSRRLRTICDVSCDPYSSFNPLPIYEHCTTLTQPSERLPAIEPPLDLIAIDHLPSLLPIESSQDFGQQLLPYLLQLDQSHAGVWGRARALFEEKRQQASTALS